MFSVEAFEFGWFSVENLANLPDSIDPFDETHPFAAVCLTCGSTFGYKVDPFASGKDPGISCDSCGDDMIGAAEYAEELAELREMAEEDRELDGLDDELDQIDEEDAAEVLETLTGQAEKWRGRLTPEGDQ